jgi:tetratricopeptide (TPR) repeat protein
LNLKIEIDDVEYLPNTLLNIGVVHEQLGEYDQAIHYYLKAVEKMRENGNSYGESIALTNIGEAYRLIGDHASALECQQKALEVAQKHGNSYPEAGAFIHLGALYQIMDEPAKALDSYQQGLAIAQQTSHGLLQSKAFMGLGQLFAEREDYPRAIEFLLQALTTAEKMGLNEQIFKAHQALSQIYEQQGDFAAALNHHKDFYEFRQKVFGEEADKNLKRVMIQAQVDKAEKEAEIYRLRHVELAARIQELEEALSQVKQLQNLLPICSYCKSIRDDDNYWQSVEGYISKNTGAAFSHGICPGCYDKVVKPQLEEMKRNR